MPLTDWDKKINNALWISITTVVVVAINFLGTRAFGECEFWFASIKVLTIIGLILVGLVIDLGGAPSHDRLGFRYWVSVMLWFCKAVRVIKGFASHRTTPALSFNTMTFRELWAVSLVSGLS